MGDDKSSVLSPKSEKELISSETQLSILDKLIKEDKKESVTKNTEPNPSNDIKSQNNNEIVRNNDNKVLKRKVTEDGVIIERVLSEGEASSGFETVSSIDSKVDIDDLDLSSSIDDDDYNIVVKVKNELAFQYKNRPVENISYHERNSKSPSWKSHRSDRISNDFNSSRRYGFRRDDKYWRSNVDKNYNYDRRDQESTERKNNEHSRRRTSNNDWSTHRDRSSKRGRWDEQDSRSKRSGSVDLNDRYKTSRSPERIRNRSLNHKDTKTDSRSLRSYDKNSTKSSPERSSPPRKKRHETSKGSSSSVWKRLEKRKSTLKKTGNDRRSPRKSESPHRKKERTPFLVELERKLKTIKPLKSSQKESNGSTDQVKSSESVVKPTQPPAFNQSYQCSNPVMNTTTLPYVQGYVYPPMPTVSVNNLPLVPGPTGLPVHILPTGEQIPHDMDGRLIPVGPNGHYLPVDPSGRLFAHIISPENQAVPIHITEDGVIRLPNSEPVPYGPEHQLPVNIDGRVIPIGPDSKPLYSCPDLPKRSPLEMMYCAGEVHSASSMPPPPPPSQAGGQETQPFVQTKTTETQTENQIILQPPVIDLSILNLLQKPSQQINKEESLNKYKKKVQDKTDCAEKEKILEVNSSRGVKRSIPVKFSRKKPAKDDTGNTSDMVLDSGDSDSTSKPEINHSNEGPVQEITVQSDDDQDVLEIVCDNEVPKSTSLETKFEDYITDKVQEAIKLLYEKNHKPPVFGRFILSDPGFLPLVYNLPNESPLLRNRIQLPFLTPNIPLKDQPITIKESNVNFKFLPQKTDFKKQPGIKQKIPILNVDFAMQCDFTSDVIKNLNLKISRMEMEISRLKRINTNLFNDYMNVQSAKQKKTEELRKALSEIQEKNKEIQSLKSFTKHSK